MKNFLLFTHFINGLLLVRFSLSKLFAWPISVKAFIEMAKPLGIDPTFFRLFTGVLITSICLGYFTSFYLIISKKVATSIKEVPFIIIANIVGIGIMVGALIAEFGLRDVPKWPLVIIAAVIIIFSIVNVSQYKKLVEKA